MSSRDAVTANSEVAEILARMRQKRVCFWSENGRLHYKAPKGALSPQEIDTLGTLSGRIVALLDESADLRLAIPRLEPRGRCEQVPLTFSQRKYWVRARLTERPALRAVAAAMTVCGPLDVRLLQQCVAEIVRRHEALRTRIVTSGSTVVQQVDESCECAIGMHDLSALPQQLRRDEVERRIHALILEPIRVDLGPLFAIELLRLQEHQHVLILVTDHIISDGYSLNLLLRDLVRAYRQAAQSRAIELPPIPIQLADYAVWQQKAQQAWLQHHGGYWTTRLAGCRRLRFPADTVLSQSGGRALDWVPVRIGEAMAATLRGWCRSRRTTLVMTVFTAFVAAMLRWCRESEAVIRFQSDGRFSPLLEHSVGYFACVLNLRMELRPQDSFSDLLERITREYCAACEHADSSYVDAQVPAYDFTRNPSFNWVPQPPGARLSADNLLPGEVSFQPREFSLPADNRAEEECDYEPSIVLFDRGSSIDGRLVFRSSRHRADTIEAFRNSFIGVLGGLLQAAERLGALEAPTWYRRDERR